MPSLMCNSPDKAEEPNSTVSGTQGRRFPSGTQGLPGECGLGLGTTARGRRRGVDETRRGPGPPSDGTQASLGMLGAHLGEHAV